MSSGAVIALAAAHHVSHGAGSGFVVAAFVCWVLWLCRDKSGSKR